MCKTNFGIFFFRPIGGEGKNSMYIVFGETESLWWGLSDHIRHLDYVTGSGTGSGTGMHIHTTGLNLYLTIEES